MKAVNLLPSEQRGAGRTSAAVSPQAPKGSAFGAYALLGFLAFLVVAAGAFVLAGNQIKDRRAELARTTQEAAAVSKQASELQSYADFKTLADQRVTTVRDLAKARFNWPRALGDVSRVLPGDVHLRTLDGTVSTSTSSGGGNALRGAVQAPAIELDGCTTSQTGVARLMSRLHDVRGVTRVTLSRTAKPDSTEAPMAPGAGSAERLCPKGSPPDFEVVVFFERAQLGAGAVPNPAGTTGTTATDAVAAASGATANATPTPTPAAGAAPAPTSTSSTSATQGVSAK